MNHLELLCTLVKQLLIHFHEELQCIVDESMDGLIPVVFAEIESKFCIFTQEVLQVQFTSGDRE
jgi:hypothetical protein